MLDAKTRQRLGHELVATAMEGRVDELEVVGDLFDGLIVVDHAHDICHEALVTVLTEHRDEALVDGFVKVHRRDAGEDVDVLELPGDGRGVLGRQLRAVRPVDLVAVVLLGIVRRGDVDARLAAVFAHGERELRRRAQGLKELDGDAVARHDAGRGARSRRRKVKILYSTFPEKARKRKTLQVFPAAGRPSVYKMV